MKTGRNRGRTPTWAVAALLGLALTTAAADRRAASPTRRPTGTSPTSGPA